MELNKVLLVGNLGRDPETKYLPSGEAVANFSIAVSRRFKDPQGEFRDDTAWVRISCFGRLAEFASNYLQKGKAVFVEGRLRESRWETPEGQKRSQLEVVAERLQFAYPKGVEDGGAGGGSDRESYSQPAPVERGPASGESNAVDDLPF